MGNITIFNMGLYVNTLDSLYSETFLLCNLTLQRVRSKMNLSVHLRTSAMKRFIVQKLGNSVSKP